jgi:hypothetical protein
LMPSCYFCKPGFFGDRRETSLCNAIDAVEHIASQFLHCLRQRISTTVNGATVIDWKLGQYQGRANRWIQPFSRRSELKQLLK